MARQSSTTNPTGLIEIAQKDVSLEKVDVNGTSHLFIKEIDLTRYRIAKNAQVSIVARAGSTSLRFPIGTVENYAKGPFDLTGLDKSHPFRFRLLVRTEDSFKWLATAENLKIRGDGDIESLLPIVSAELGQRLWNLIIDDEGALLQCNVRIFPNGASAESYPPFRALVLPEALRQILHHIAEDPGMLDAEDTIWVEWKEWMRKLGIEAPPEDEDHHKNWVRESVGIFCTTFESADDLQRHLSTEDCHD